MIRDFLRETLSLRWRAWMTKYYVGRYFNNRTFYNIQSQSLIDNPDQRIVDDLSAFTGTALSFALSMFNSTIDLISFSGILYGIYPPLFGVLIVYSLGGTAISVAIGKVGFFHFLQNSIFVQGRFGSLFKYDAGYILQYIINCYERKCHLRIASTIAGLGGLEFHAGKEGSRFSVWSSPCQGECRVHCILRGRRK